MAHHNKADELLLAAILRVEKRIEDVAEGSLKAERVSAITALQQLEVSEQILHVLREIRHELRPPKPLTAFIGVLFHLKDGTMSFNTLSLNVGQTSTASIVPLLADGVTPSGGTLSAVSYNFTDPSATVVLNADGVTALVTGVAASTAGAVIGTAVATVTDTDGVVSQWNQSFTILVAGVVPPAQLTQSVAVSFTDPV